MRLTRRTFLNYSATLGVATALQPLLAPWARSAYANDMRGLAALSGTEFDLHIERKTIPFDGKPGNTICVNGQVPAPLLRWKEGDTLTLRVHNHLDVDTSIHWHGILLPFQMDGVPGLTFPGIKPGETFTYRFPLKQAGTYWYHSHSGLQEQSGHYGPIIIEPKDKDPVAYDREYIVVLSDWTFEDPERVFAKLKKMSESYNFQKRTFVDFLHDARERGLQAALSERAMWDQMRMSPTDIADVTGATYTYLVNGHGPGDNWTGLFKKGERVRLRIVNASAMTIFNVRIPGLPMSVVQADGLNIQPVETDEFQIGVAETYDVVVRPQLDAYTIVAESIDRSGLARATLATKPGMSAEVPALRPRPTLTMKDMGMAHHDMAGHDMAGHDMAGHDMAGHDMGDHSMHGMDHGNMAMNSSDTQKHQHPKGPGVMNVAEAPTNRLSEPGLGLEDVPHRVLVYTDLKSLDQNPDLRAPERELELHLTSNMERYMWSFDGKKFSEVDEPIRFYQGERLRLTMVNDTMMSHPIHLHGMFFDVVNGQDTHKPRKHTIIMKPGDKVSVDITPEEPGDWAFHCHLLYHMVAGMMRTVRVEKRRKDLRTT